MRSAAGVMAEKLGGTRGGGSDVLAEAAAV